MNPWVLLGIAGVGVVVWQALRAQPPSTPQQPSVTLRLPDLSQVQLPTVTLPTVPMTSPPTTSSPPPTSSGVEVEQTYEFLRLINQYRSGLGLPTLARSDLLDHVAQGHANEMAREGYLGHTNRAGLSPFQRMQNAGYRGMAMAENVACGHPDAQATFEQWRNSPGHDANMRNAAFGAIGIASAPSSSDCRFYWVTNFGDTLQ